MIKVAKFGGSSLSSYEQVKKVVAIIKSDAARRFIVVSAPGKRNKEDIKITDLLVKIHLARLENEPFESYLEQIIARYTEIGQAFQVGADLLQVIAENFRKIARTPDLTEPHYLDTLLASGENNNAHLLAGILQAQGLKARYFSPKELGLFVSDDPQNARVLLKSYTSIYQWRQTEEILIIPGFFGYTETNEICTFSRGGSDISGAIVAAGIKADLYENFTDVNGIYSAQPNFIHKPETIKEITYREMRELAYAGFSVFHEEALMPSFRARVPVVIKNTNDPDHPGTKITNSRNVLANPVVGIASDEGFSMIYINKYLMNKEVGFTLRVLKIFKDFGINYEHMPSGIDDISIIFRADQLTPYLEEELLRKIAYEIDPDELRITHDLCLVVVVGEGMKHRVGLMAESTAALARKEINIEMINQGSSEVSIMFGIHKDREQDAIRSLYYTFF